MGVMENKGECENTVWGLFRVMIHMEFFDYPKYPIHRELRDAVSRTIALYGN